MVKRLLEMKVQVNEVLCALGVDTLLVADWVRLEELASLLEPFATQTDVLQTDACSLSSVIPSLLDLHFHLQAFPHCKSLIKAMLADMRCRFDCFLNPDSPDFVAIPAASCLLHPLLATVLLTPDMSSLYDAAKNYIVLEVLSNLNYTILICTTVMYDCRLYIIYY